MKQKEAGIYRSEHFHSAGSVHFLTGVDILELAKLRAVKVGGKWRLTPNLPDRVGALTNRSQF